jgi:hypothetical protein
VPEYGFFEMNSVANENKVCWKCYFKDVLATKWPKFSVHFTNERKLRQNLLEIKFAEGTQSGLRVTKILSLFRNATVA